MKVVPAILAETFNDFLVRIRQAERFTNYVQIDYRHPFKREVLKKIEEARKTFPEKKISVDGGVSLDNLKSFMDIGVDSVCVGSRIFLEGNPEGNYRRFIQRVRELRAH